MSPVFLNWRHKDTHLSWKLIHCEPRFYIWVAKLAGIWHLCKSFSVLFLASSCIIAELWLSSWYETWFIKTGSGTHRRSSADIGKWIWAVESPLIISHAREAFAHHTKNGFGDIWRMKRWKHGGIRWMCYRGLLALAATRTFVPT